MKIALVHEWLTNYAGSERCIHALKEVFPSAPLYTSIYNEKKMPEVFKSYDIRTSFLQILPMAKNKHQAYLPLMPLAFENFDFSEFDVVISSCHACAKGIITKPETLHISYLYTPLRYIWSHYQEYKNYGKFAFLKKILLPIPFSYMRLWDKSAIDRVDVLVSDCKYVAARTEKYYRRKSHIIYPPVNTSVYNVSKNPSRSFYLMVGRLVPYKRFDLAIKAFNNLGLPLKIVGTGSEYSKLKAMAKKNIEFLGYLPDHEISELYSNCEAFIFPGEEDFGITPLEAQAAGRRGARRRCWLRGSPG